MRYLALGLIGVVGAASAAQEDIDFPRWVISSKLETENTKFTDVSVGKWQLNQNFCLTYKFDPNFYASASLTLADRNTYNYGIGGGFQVPLAYFTPYVELGYKHLASNSSKINYDAGVYFPVKMFCFSLEIDNPIRSDEGAKAGVSYLVRDNMSVNADYFMSLNNKWNGMDVGLSYAI